MNQKYTESHPQWALTLNGLRKIIHETHETNAYGDGLPLQKHSLKITNCLEEPCGSIAVAIFRV